MQDSQTGQIVRIGRKVGRLFKLNSLHIPPVAVLVPAIFASTYSSIKLLHSHLGHASLPLVKILVSRGLLGSDSSRPFDCMSCQLSKHPSLPFNNSESNTSITFWSDSFQCMRSISYHHYWWVIILCYFYGWFFWIHLDLSDKKIILMFSPYITILPKWLTQFSKVINIFRFDNVLCRHPILYLPKSRIPNPNDDTILSIEKNSE